jgi:hypothetical protein
LKKIDSLINHDLPSLSVLLIISSNVRIITGFKGRELQKGYSGEISIWFEASHKFVKRNMVGSKQKKTVSTKQ